MLPLRNDNDETPPGESGLKRVIFFMAALVVMVVILLLPEPQAIDSGKGALALSAQGKASLAVLALAVLLWATEAIPFPVTGMLAMVLMVVTGVAPFRDLVQWGFGSTIVLFFLGVLVFSAAVAETGLLQRITIPVLRRFGDRPKALLFAFLTVGALLSGWITDMAVAAMLLPVGTAILRDAGVKPLKSNFGKALMISCAWGPLIGGVSTPAGCGPNPLTMQYLKDLAGIEFSFIDWMLVGFPATILMIPAGWLVLVKMFPPESIDLKPTAEEDRRRLAELGPLKKNEIATIVIFGLMVCLWLFPDLPRHLTGGRIGRLDIGLVAVACACLFFLPGIRVLTWKTAERGVNWGGILLIVAGMALGKAVYATGAAEWLAYVVFHRLGDLHPVGIVFAVVLGVSLMKVMFSSNTVTGAIMVPLLIALAGQLDLDPALVAIPAGITASLAFILVTSTPTNVIPHSSGYFSVADMAKAGVVMTLVSSVCVTLSICIMGRLTGIIRW